MDANALIDAAAAEPSLDELFSRQTLTKPERRLLIEKLRAERAAWEVKQDKKAAKKEGLEE